MRRKPVELAVSLIIIIFLPVALIGLVRGLAVCLDEFYTGNLDPGVNFSRNYSF
jgi:hypothetical protein